MDLDSTCGNLKLAIVAITRITQLIWFDTILVRLVWIVHFKVYLSSKGSHSLINTYVSTWRPDFWKTVGDDIVDSPKFVDWVVACISLGNISVIVTQWKKRSKIYFLTLTAGKIESITPHIMILTKYLQYCCLVEGTLSFWGFAHQDLNGHCVFEVFLGALVCQYDLRLAYSADAVLSFSLDHMENRSHRGLKRTKWDYCEKL